MSYTIEQYNQLKAAIASGAKRVKYADKEVEYNSVTDMLRVLGLMESELGISPSKGNRKVLTTYRSGLINPATGTNTNNW